MALFSKSKIVKVRDGNKKMHVEHPYLGTSSVFFKLAAHTVAHIKYENALNRDIYISNFYMSLDTADDQLKDVIFYPIIY